MKGIQVSTLLWYGDKNLNLTFPEEWKVNLYPMKGDQLPRLRNEQIKTAFSKTIGSQPLKKLVKGRKEAVIVVDDMARATKAYQLIPHILEDLHNSGISRDHVRFIIGLGAHSPIDRIDLVKKLGEEIVEQYSVFNHNAFGNLCYLGETSRGTPVSINSEFMACDLKIGIGSIVPHPQTGFGGGAKIILPGIAGIDTIAHNHAKIGGFKDSDPNATVGWGKYSKNVQRLDMVETAKMVDLDIKIDAIMNGRAEISGLFIGDVSAEFDEGIKMARNVYATNVPQDVDIVVANTYFKANEARLAMWLATTTVKAGGSVVLVANAPEGQVTHYLYGKFGKELGGTLYRGNRHNSKIGRLIIYSKYEMKDPCLQILDPDEQIWFNNWKEVLEELQKVHTSGARVAVFPYAEIQIPPKEIQ